MSRPLLYLRTSLPSQKTHERTREREIKTRERERKIME